MVTTDVILLLGLLLLAVVAALQVRLLMRKPPVVELPSFDPLAARMMERLDTLERGVRDESRVTARELRAEVGERLDRNARSVQSMLEQVHRGLGEMQSLAGGVSDLKKVLANVRARGAWGEIQLGALLEQILSPEQYQRNVATRGTSERVEFAVKLPGEDDQTVWLPIDSKFPLDSYQRLLDAFESGQTEQVDLMARQLEAAIKASARAIRDKYLEPPRTTDFAILFLPTESLYAEVLRRTALVDLLQREYRVTLAGPMTLAALLNSLQMGFRTLAIQKRSSEVWTVLGEAKTEFTRYAGSLDKVRKKLQEAGEALDDAQVRTRAIQRKLRDVEEGSAEFRLTAPPE
jgi:DNA recombination protein RmuC